MRIFKWIAGLALAGLLLARPGEASAGALAAAERWRVAVAPAIFPFLALLPLLTGDEAAAVYRRLLGGWMDRLFGLPGAAAPALVIGMIAGSPAGTMAARRVAGRSGMTRGQLHRLAAALPGFSPAFLLGGVGAGLLGSAAQGAVLLRAQVLTQLTLLALLRRAWRNRAEPVPPPGEAEESQPVRAAALAVVGVCGWMALFGALAGAARSLAGPAADALLCLMDVPSGAGTVCALPLPGEARLVLLAALCGSGGACVGMQNLSALKGCGMRPAEYFTARLPAAALCAGFTALQLRLGDLPPLPLRPPLPVSALAAAALACPVLVKMRKPNF